MKNALSLLLVLTSVLLLSCEKEKPEPTDISTKIIITTASATSIEYRSASINGTLGVTYERTVQDYGHCWDTIVNPDITKNITSFGNQKGTKTYTSLLKDLLPGKQYFVRGYFTIDNTTVYSTENSFTTKPVGLPVVDIDSVKFNTLVSISFWGQVLQANDDTIITRGVCWNTVGNPTINDSVTINGYGLGKYTCEITGLSLNTTYYIRAFATNTANTAYSLIDSFKTERGLPILSTTPISEILATSAKSGGSITYDGGFPVTARGVCWSISQNPTISDSKTTNGNGTGTFTSSMTGLSSNTTYYVRAYATNAQGTSYGNQVSFATPNNIMLLTVTTTTVTSITTTTAQSGGNVTSDGGATVSARGVCWSTSQNPTTGNNKTTNGTGTGTFTSSLTGLLPNTIYYVRAYAINSMGTGYGNQLNFTTNNITLPTVTTTTVTSITSTSAKSGGNVTSDGGATVSERGVCWGPGQNPTTVNVRQISGAGTGIFISNLTQLSPSTTYYVRAYAINSKGTAYGNQVSFITPPSSANNPPVVTSSPVLSIYEDVPYSYTLTATDADVADVLTYLAITKPSWLSFNSSTHVLSGTPGNNNVGSHYVSLSVSDGKVTVYNNFTITVNNINDYPVITSTPALSVEVNTYYSYQITATDVDMDVLSYSSVTLPSWLSFNTSTGLLSGTPALADKGDHLVILTVSDGTVYVDQNFIINVYQPTGTFTDSRDGQIYNWVKIGNQVWMAENLAYLPEVSPPSSGSTAESYYYVYDYNDSIVNEAKVTSNYAIYGVLYNWPAAMNGTGSSSSNPSGVQGVCPNGWHLPSDAEWTELADYLGGEVLAGGKLKETGYDHWASPNSAADNSSNFTALPGGEFINNGGFSGIGTNGWWWSATENHAECTERRSLSYLIGEVSRGSCYYTASGFSVRCIKD